MPILNWIGKDAVVNHDKDVSFRLLKKNKSKSIGDSENLIVEGDNLEALKSLLPYYQNKIKCIYIDPPYNTGNTSWEYNDNSNSPKIKKWLGTIVDSDDLTRHDKWLCMMYPRLKLLKNLLRDDGAIFISIDDAEQSNLRQIADEIFIQDNFIANIIWQKKHTSSNDAKFISDNHDFILLYAKDIKKLNIRFKKRTKEQEEIYKNPDNDSRGLWTSSPIQAKTPNPKDIYTITTPSGRKVNPPNGTSWRFSEKRFEELLSENRIWFGELGNNVPRFKRFLTEVQEGVIDKTIWLRDEVGDNQEAKTELKKIIPSETFATPKPVRLMKKIINMVSSGNDIILDSFAGSGTTGHAVLELNNEDKGNRQFILVELESKICKNITSQRIKKIIKGYSFKGTDSDVIYKRKLSVTDLRNMEDVFNDIDDVKTENKIFQRFKLQLKNGTLQLIGENDSSSRKEGLDGGFQYAVLDKKLFNSDGRLNETCTFDELASYIFFTETKTILDTKKIDKTRIDTFNDMEFHLIFDGIGKNKLDRKFLTNLDKQKTKIIYADKCTVDDSVLKKYNVIFKQIPYEVREF
tara:strand:+ start:141 stop:1868 length:1728 start_codon:yes stop_codon:yes gene_type:complete